MPTAEQVRFVGPSTLTTNGGISNWSPHPARRARRGCPMPACGDAGSAVADRAGQRDACPARRVSAEGGEEGSDVGDVGRGFLHGDEMVSRVAGGPVGDLVVAVGEFAHQG